MKKFKILAILIIIVGLIYWFFYKNSNGETSEKIEYKWEEVKKNDVEIKILSTGSISPFTEVEIKSSIRGRIEKVLVKEGDTVKKGESLASISSEDRNAILDAANSQMQFAKSSGDKSAIEEAQNSYNIAVEAYKPVYITSTIDGEIINRSAEPGQNVDLSSALFVIADRLVARVDVDEVDIGKIKTGMHAYINLDSFPDEQVDAKVAKISRQGKTQSDVVVYEILVEPVKIPEHWVSGMTANVEFVVEKSVDVKTVAKSSIQKRKKGKKGKDNYYVEIYKEDGSIEERDVKIGLSDGKLQEIKEGLELDEKVVTEKVTVKSNDEQSNPFMRRRRK